MPLDKTFTQHRDPMQAFANRVSRRTASPIVDVSNPWPKFQLVDNAYNRRDCA
jgi:hypothetical protein